LVNSPIKRNKNVKNGMGLGFQSSMTCSIKAEHRAAYKGKENRGERPEALGSAITPKSYILEKEVTSGEDARKGEHGTISGSCPL